MNLSSNVAIFKKLIWKLQNSKDEGSSGDCPTLDLPPFVQRFCSSLFFLGWTFKWDWSIYSMFQTLGVHYPESLTLLMFYLSFPVNGDYTQWGSWTECDVTCGGGHRQRSRACTSPVPEFGGLNCTHLGPTVQSDVCNSRPCAREYFEMASCNCCQALYKLQKGRKLFVQLNKSSTI